jgi:Integrase zinc binding domain
MACASTNQSDAFTQRTRAAFSQHLSENPNKRRVSPTDKDVLIGWLTNTHQRPESQEEYSRRNYVRKTFVWNENSQSLLAIAKHGEDKARSVVTTDMITDVVEMVHRDNGHAGWDATWKDVSTSFYGILRGDVIFLLKQCQTCSQNPSKRPKGSAPMVLPLGQSDHRSFDCLNMDDVQYDSCSWDILEIDRSGSAQTLDNFVQGLDERPESTLGTRL